ncbi:MAG: hypothetical protein IIB73_06240 [Proteobacteria bacterium]|nr:hypothetical protein [Pseudomonadota bacterium]
MIYKTCLPIFFTGFVISACASHEPPFHPGLSQLNPAYLVTADEGYEWARVKDDNLPTFTGSPEWRNYMAFLEKKFLEYGVVDVTRNSWPFERWDTSDDATDWSLVSDGESVRVANYGAYSGSTGPEGISAELIYYDHDNPPESIAGKIVVIPTKPHPKPPYSEDYIKNFTFNDYEYRADDETFQPLFQYIDPADTFTFDIWWQLAQGLDKIPAKGGAAGAVIVYDMAYDRTGGLYTFPVPTLYESPTLILDREAGAKVIADAKASKMANLRLEATLVQAEAYQLIAYLPGKDYGTPQDEQIVLVTHTDGPSITQDNGALGLLAIVKYFSNIPQAQRPRTLTVYLDCRHYIPGMEAEFKQQTWLTRHPEAKELIVGMIQIEHLGEMDYREVDGRIEATGLTEQSYLWTRNNQLLIDEAIKAVKKHGWSRVQVSVPERPGINGSLQQVWWGVGTLGLRDSGYGCDIWHCLDVPGYGLGGFLGHYWTSHARIDRWNKDLFLAQVATMTQLTAVLMTADLEEIKPLRPID